MTDAPRDIVLRIRLAGGHEHQLTLREDAPELMALYTALASPGAGEEILQLPLDGGRAACTLRASQLVSIVSEPPVVLELERRAAVPPPPATRLRRPRFLIIDDFLSPAEHRELLALALAAEDAFRAGTTKGDDPEYRQNLVIMEFGTSVHGRLLQSRLLMWFPLLAKSFGMPMFPLGMLESQFTAAGEGQYYKVHSDEAPDCPRVLSCVYYLHREPRGFAGGDLRLYDCVEWDGGRRAAESFTAVEPVANRMVVFPSEEFHEAMPVRCPSGAFEDSRFAITSWLHRAAAPDAHASFGWGHFHCGVVAPQFVATPAAGGGAP